jgi:uncharacterized repeat protein (TIGR03803 family)
MSQQPIKRPNEDGRGLVEVKRQKRRRPARGAVLARLELLEKRFLLTYTLANDYGFNSTDGQHSQAPLITDGQGNFYGTTYYGGSGDDGTVFMESGGTITTLVNFNGANGANPAAPLVFDDGNLYGTTSEGGVDNDGTVFEISGGTLAASVSFDGADGAVPLGGLTVDGGELVGMTQQGGDLTKGYGDGIGVIYEVQPGLGAGPTAPGRNHLT